ncbi:MAG: hypothetical protein AAGE01_25405, partial [Pseudomonadota bacterium]
FGFLPVPIIITDPAVDGGLGAIGLFFHETEEQAEQRREALESSEDGSRFLLTPSISAVAAAATGNGSWFAGGGHVGFWKEGRLRYTGFGGYGDVNIDFYGTGDFNLIRPIEINTRAAMIGNTLKFKVGERPLFVGITQRYTDAKISLARPRDVPAQLFDPSVDGATAQEIRLALSRDVALSALGLVVELDTRDNFFSAHAGYRYELRQLWYRDALGSDIDYDLTAFEGLNYWPLTEAWRLGLRLDFESTDADRVLPPFATPGVSLRGIPAARYQGNSVGAVEAEVTWQLNRRWSVNVFSGVGRAAGKFSDLSDATSRVTKGAGFRYLIASRYGFEAGVDVARGPEDTVFYIQAGSAW